VQVAEQSPSATKLLVKFSSEVSDFAEVSSGRNDRLALGIALSDKGGLANKPLGGGNLVKNISFDQMDSILIINFDTAKPSFLKSKKINPTTIEVSISDGSPSASARPSQRGHKVPLPQEGPAMASAAPMAPSTTPAPPMANASDNEFFELVRLEYADVSEVAGLLSRESTPKANNVFRPREPSFGSNNLASNGMNYSSQQMQMQGQSSSEDAPLGQSVDNIISIDRRLNAIMLKGSRETIARYKALIAMIDVPVENVMLETQMVELTSSGARALGIDLANSNGQIAVASMHMGEAVSSGLGTNAGLWLKSVAVQAAIYAQVQKGEARIVSRPQISAQNGGTAKIVTGDALPILTSIALSGVNGVSQQVQYVNVGVTLQIAPRTTSDGHVTSQIFCVLSSVSGYSQGYPTISQREAQTTATVRDGESFVIGGLTQDAKIDTTSKTPILGDVPILGKIFNTNRAATSKSELYIIITPHIMREGKSLG
jgi:general secretion pathway protein D